MSYKELHDASTALQSAYRERITTLESRLQEAVKGLNHYRTHAAALEVKLRAADNAMAAADEALQSANDQLDKVSDFEVFAQIEGACNLIAAAFAIPVRYTTDDSKAATLAHYTAVAEQAEREAKGLKPFDAADCLKTPEECAAYLEEFVDDSSKLIRSGVWDVVRAVQRMVLGGLTAPAAVAGWQVWWGLSQMRPCKTIHPTREAAEAEARSIKSNTEIRPVYHAAPAADAPATRVLSQAARDVLAERRRQIDAEGWTPAYDDGYRDGELALAASSYACAAANFDDAARDFPWPMSWWKPSTSRRNLEKAGALIIAEIERLDRAAAKKGGRDE